MKKVKFFAIYFLIPLALGVIGKTLFFQGSAVDKEYHNVPNLDDDLVQAKVPEKIDYIFHVKPILSDRCYLCHGPDDGTREAGLRLDVKEGAYAAIGEHFDRYAIVPGDVATSQMAFRINSDDPLKRMPPVDSNLSLTDYEKQILTKWIGQGAEWKEHWAFVPPSKPDIPAKSEWAKNEIDRFILKKLDEQGLSPSEKATKEKLLRRVHFDLTGLPPTIEEIDGFLNDNSKDAFEKVIDRLLASPSYGEHMTAEWLDIARYADTHGYQDDLERVMWPWRDWVIHAFNKNLPYDEFVTWQLAGDLLPDAGLEQIMATGFNRNHKITQEGGVIDEEYRVEYVMDRVATTAKAFMGMTMECARCHSHKYDPITMDEFYQFYSFFNQVDEKGRIEYGEIPQPNITISNKEIEEVLAFVNKPDSITSIQLMVMKDAESQVRKTHVLDRGVYDKPKQEVDYGTPNKILPFESKFDKNRLGLANWFFDDNHPLTARVAVNRLWQRMFGVGLVASTGDFGNQGALPSHPELLDWLAVTFKEDGWDMKKMLKRMAMSATYQQSAKADSKKLQSDPANVYLARSSRHKLSAEMVRDNALYISGLMVDKVGGPSVKPYQPEGLWAETTSGQGLTEYIMDTGENLYRRSLYTFWKRTVPPPAMTIFDAATRDDCTVKRQKTSTPLQALVMLNDPQIIEASKVLSTQVLKDDNTSNEDRITSVFRMITSRFPTEKELDDLGEYLTEIKETYKGNIEGVSAENYAYTSLISLIFNLDEALVKG
jgi:hypothetical protein